MTTHSSLNQTKCTRAPTKRHCSPTEAVLVGRLAALPDFARILEARPHGVDMGKEVGSCGKDAT